MWFLFTLSCYIFFSMQPDYSSESLVSKQKNLSHLPFTALSLSCSTALKEKGRGERP
jgi:hypothetical protein